MYNNKYRALPIFPLLALAPCPLALMRVQTVAEI